MNEFDDLILPSDEEVKRETQALRHSQFMKGRPSPNKGKPGVIPDAASRQRNREKHLGRETTPEWAANISKAKKGKALTDEHRAALKNAKTPEYSKKMSEISSKLIYTTPKGVFYNRKDLIEAFPEYSAIALWKMATYNIKGFSKKVKDS